MKSGLLNSWIGGGVILAVLVWLHWLAYRIGEKRRMRKRSAEVQTRRPARTVDDRFSEPPIV